MHPRPLIAAALAAMICAVAAAPAWAGGKGDARTEGPGVAAEATSEESGPAAPYRGGAKGQTCTYTPLSPEDSMVADFLHTRDQGLPPHTDGGAWYGKICVDEQGNSTGTVVWFWRPPRRAAAPATLAARVFRYMPIPLPGIGMNPPPERDQLVRLPVWLWVDAAGWNPVSTSASAGGVTVTVRAEPQRVVWNMGDGDTVVCGPGTSYDLARPPEAQTSDCSYAYPHSSASQPGERYQVTATTEWHATWTVVGAPGGGDLGVISRTATASLRVAEAQAVNTTPSS